MEAIKVALGRGETLIGRLLLFDALKLRFRELKLKKDPDCPICGTNPSVTELIDYEAFCGIGSEPPPQVGDEVDPETLADEIGGKEDLVVVDVRESYESEICSIEGSVLIPLGSLPGRLAELDGHAEIVTYCHHGMRSMQALQILRAAGFPNVRSLRGGIDAWADDVDTDMAKY